MRCTALPIELHGWGWQSCCGAQPKVQRECRASVTCRPRRSRHRLALGLRVCSMNWCMRSIVRDQEPAVSDGSSRRWRQHGPRLQHGATTRRTVFCDALNSRGYAVQQNGAVAWTSPRAAGTFPAGKLARVQSHCYLQSTLFLHPLMNTVHIDQACPSTAQPPSALAQAAGGSPEAGLFRLPLPTLDAKSVLQWVLAR